MVRVGVVFAGAAATLYQASGATTWTYAGTGGLTFGGAAARSKTKAALASGKGVVGITSHLGNWEVLNHFYCAQCKPIIFYRPPKLKAVEMKVEDKNRLSVEELDARIGAAIRARWRSHPRSFFVPD